MSPNAGLLSLGLILLAAPLALGTARLAGAGSSLIARMKADTEALQRLALCADRAMELLSEEEPHEPDSFLNPYQTQIDALAAESGTGITLTDLSSRFNLNTLRKSMFQGTELLTYMKPGMSPAALQQHRVDAGFSLETARHYGDFFYAEALARYLTPWGYWNINTADEFSLEQIFAIRSGDEAAAGWFHGRIREALEEGRLISAEELQGFIGLDYYKEIFPLINAAPPININTADEWIIAQLLSYPAFRVSDPEATTLSLISLRRGRAISRAEIIDLIPVSPEKERNEKGEEVLSKEENRLFAWLGDTTWFWEIRVVDEAGGVYTRVVARLPDESELGRERRYRIVREEIPW